MSKVEEIVIPNNIIKKAPSRMRLKNKLNELEINEKYKADRKNTEMYAKFKKKEERFVK